MPKFRIEVHNGKTRVWDLATGKELVCERVEFTSVIGGPTRLSVTLVDDNPEISGEVDGYALKRCVTDLGGGYTMHALVPVDGRKTGSVTISDPVNVEPSSELLHNCTFKNNSIANADKPIAAGYNCIENSPTGGYTFDPPMFPAPAPSVTIGFDIQAADGIEVVARKFTCSWCKDTFAGDSLQGFCLNCFNAGHAPEPKKIKFREFL